MVGVNSKTWLDIYEIVGVDKFSLQRTFKIDIYPF